MPSAEGGDNNQLTNPLRTYISTAEAADILGVSQRAIQEQARIGKLPCEQLPGRTGAYLLYRADIQKMAHDKQEAALARAS